MGSEQKGRLNTHLTKTSEFVSSGHSKERSLMQHVPGGRYPDILWGSKSPPAQFLGSIRLTAAQTRQTPLPRGPRSLPTSWELNRRSDELCRKNSEEDFKIYSVKLLFENILEPNTNSLSMQGSTLPRLLRFQVLSQVSRRRTPSATPHT